MDRELRVSLFKLVASAAVAVALLVVCLSNVDGAIKAVGGTLLVVVAGPVSLLVAIDTGRAFRRRGIGQAATLASKLPQQFLGSLACIAAVTGLALSEYGDIPNPLFRLYGAAVSTFILIYGIRLLQRKDNPRLPQSRDESS